MSAHLETYAVSKLYEGLSRSFSVVEYHPKFHRPSEFVPVFQQHSHLIVSSEEDLIPTLMFISDHSTEWFREFMGAFLEVPTGITPLSLLTELLWYFYLSPQPIMIPQEEISILLKVFSGPIQLSAEEARINLYQILTQTKIPRKYLTKRLVRRFPEKLPNLFTWFPNKPHRIYRHLFVMFQMLWGMDDHLRNLETVDFLDTEFLSEYSPEYFEILHDYERHYPSEIASVLDQMEVLIPDLVALVDSYAQGDNIETLATRLGMVIPKAYDNFPQNTQYFFQEYLSYGARFGNDSPREIVLPLKGDLSPLLRKVSDCELIRRYCITGDFDNRRGLIKLVQESELGLRQAVRRFIMRTTDVKEVIEKEASGHPDPTMFWAHSRPEIRKYLAKLWPLQVTLLLGSRQGIRI